MRSCLQQYICPLLFIQKALSEQIIFIKNGRYIITKIQGGIDFKSFMLAHNVSIGSVFTLNYSPRFSRLINITIRQKILSIRKEDFEKIECTQIA